MWWKKKTTESSKPALVAEDTFRPGDAGVLDGPAPVGRYGVTFEDDGETGYFYALDMSLNDQPILDAMHIYDVAAVSDREKPSIFQIVWSVDNLKAALFINQYPHAVYDFEADRGYCRSNFPPPAPGGFSSEGHEWSESAVRFFR